MEGTIKYSYSAVNTLRTCNRKYYFASILASFHRKDPLRRKAYELKCVQNLKMWQGSVVDKTMEKVIIPAIKQKQALNFQSFAEQAIALAERQFNYSKLQVYRDDSLRKADVEDDFCILDIHELGKPFCEQDLTEAYQVIQQAILNIENICMPDGKKLVDFLWECNQLVPNITNWSVLIEDGRLAPQIDLIAYHNWKPVVIDWKLSASYTSDYARQLILCGITVFLKRKENPSKQPHELGDISLYEVNLLKSTVRAHDFSQQAYNEMIDYVALTSRDIKLLRSGEIDGQIDIEAFETTDDEGHCKLCNFRSLCSYILLNDHFDETSYAEFVRDYQLC